jgi:transcriptional regulator with XRE-family HTH domain
MEKKLNKKGAAGILHRRYIKDDPKRKESLEQERINVRVAKMIYDLRIGAGLNQTELAALVETTQSVISRLEDADYEGHSLTMLERIAEKLRHKLRVVALPQIPEGERIHHVFQTVMTNLRREHGLTIDKLAKELSVERSEIQAMEQSIDYRPSPMMLYNLSKFYKIPQTRLNALAGATIDIPEDIRREASRYAAQSESFTSLTEEEKKSLDSFVKFLRTGA